MLEITEAITMDITKAITLALTKTLPRAVLSPYKGMYPPVPSQVLRPVLEP